MRRTSLAALLVFVLILVFMSAVQAQNPQKILNQYISDLQKNPNNYALREKIIKFVQTMKPAPVVPEEANRHLIMADTFLKKAKNNKGCELAISEYKEALLIAPWSSAAYNNMGILLEQVGRYDEAISALKLYIATGPPDARAAQNKIYQIEAEKKLAAQESSPAAIAEKKKSTTATEIKRDGRFIAYDNGTVLDTWTNLMWAAHDNGSAINWETAKAYCENYRGGGYTDWRMPTLDELAKLYDSSKSFRTQYAYVHLTELILLPTVSAWASETRGSDALVFNFDRGTWYGFRRVSDNLAGGALPVRSGK